MPDRSARAPADHGGGAPYGDGGPRARADDLIADYVEHCRMHGRTWAEIGAVLGVTRQAAQQRFLAPHRRYAAEEFAAELRTALAEAAPETPAA